MRDKELLIFDMDGTIIDSIPALAKSVNYALKELNLPTYPQEVIANWVGNGADILIKRGLCGKKDYIEPNEEIFKKAKELLLNYYKDHLTDGCSLFDGVLDTLEYLYNKNYTLAIATNKPHNFVQTMLKDFNIDRFFKVALGAGIVPNKKPHPDILLKICSDLDIDKNSSVMIGDSSSDIKAAKAANIDSIALTFGYNQGVDLKSLNPTYIFDRFDKLKEIFWNN